MNFPLGYTNEITQYLKSLGENNSGRNNNIYFIGPAPAREEDLKKYGKCSLYFFRSGGCTLGRVSTDAHSKILEFSVYGNFSTIDFGMSPKSLEQDLNSKFKNKKLKFSV